MTYALPTQESLTVELKSDRKRLPDAELVEAVVCLANAERRAQLRAEFDAHYARLYGLTRDELRYILDPADVMGADYPSETFRVLKNKELRDLGEYRTQRLVLAAWDALEKGELQTC